MTGWSPLGRRAAELGSVSGCFTPDALAQALGLGADETELRATLWRELSSHVTEVLPGMRDGPAEVVDGPRYGWFLSADARHAILSAQRSRGQLRRLIGLAPPLWSGDDFGRLLQALLREDRVSVDGGLSVNDEDQVLAEMRRCGALLDATQFALGTPALDQDRLKAIEGEAKRHIQELQRRRDLLIVLPRKHFGYAEERTLLSRFLRGVEEGGDARPIFLSGIGGVGKSALHARLFRYWQRRKDSPLTVVLDFDRRQLNSGEPIELLREVLRQCAAGLFEKDIGPEQAESLAKELKTARYRLAEVNPDATFDRQLAELASSGMAGLAGAWADPLRQLPIAVAFDSFEALDRRGGRNVDDVLRLEAMLRDQLPNLRSVFSGREEPLPGPAMTMAFGLPARRLRLTGMSRAEGAKLIEAEDRRLAGPEGKPRIMSAQRQRIAEVLHGHPLDMLMFVQFAHGADGDIEALLADLERGRGHQSDFAQAFLYERILDRIDRPEIRALAHPGLVLRQISADLLRDVLAGPCLGRSPSDPLTEIEAERLIAALEEEYWLVEPDDQGFDLRHRPELRRKMLPGMFAPPRSGARPEERAEAEARLSSVTNVCALAADWFAEGPPPGGPPPGDAAALARWQSLPERLRKVHAHYYRAFVAPDRPPDIGPEFARDVDVELGQDVETMPIAWRAQIKALLDQDMSAEEQASLDRVLFEEVEGSRYLQESMAGRGSRAESSGPPEEADPRVLSAARLERDIAAAFAAADFARVEALTWPYFDALARDEGPADSRFLEIAQGGYTRTALWMVLLVVSSRATGNSLRLPLPDPGLSRSFGPLTSAILLSASGEAAPDDVARVLAGGLPLDGPTERYRNDLRANFLPEEALARPLAYRSAALCAPPPFAGLRPGDAFDPDQAAFQKLDRFHQLKTVTLDDLNTLYSERHGARFLLETPTDGRSLRFLRGLSPELYPPLILALRDCDQAALAVLTKVIEQRAPRWPEDVLVSDRALLQETAPLVVETADRYGILPEVALALGGHTPSALRVAQMHRRITEWFCEGAL
ncbi:hypothetical protein KUV28_17640 [Ferrimonas balearica]|nr:hypothetical protein [Ferrimonas balearica]